MNTLKFAGIVPKLYYMNAVKTLPKANFRRTIGFLKNNEELVIRHDIFNMRSDGITGMPGSGAGKGGGAGGSVKESGGRLGEYGSAQEEYYFFNKQREQLKNMKKKEKTDKPGESSQEDDK